MTQVVIAFQGGRAWRKHQRAQSERRRASTPHASPANSPSCTPCAVSSRAGSSQTSPTWLGSSASRAGVTQLTDLLLLAPEVQEEILFLELPPGAQPLKRGLREAVLGTIEWQQQRRRWRG